MSLSRLSALARFCAGVFVGSLLVHPIASYADPITKSSLASVPLQGLNPVKPNIMFTLDDSLSMKNEYLPGYVAENGFWTALYCRDGRTCGRVSIFAPGVISSADPPARTSNFNRQFYNPAATYDQGRRSDGLTRLPYESPGTEGSFASVYSEGFAGYPGSNTGSTINLTTGYPDTAWCNNQASSPPSAADKATAFGDGSKCRLNGRDYPAFTEFLAAAILWTTPAVAAGYNYPNARSVATGLGTTCGVNESCVFSTPAAVTGNPYYYTISKVQFCSNKNDGGFGVSGCQDRWGPTADPAVSAYFVRYGTDASLAFDPQSFKRVDIKPTGFHVNGVLVGTNPSGTGLGYAQEMANFAKWYTFYRTRIDAMKTAGGLAFSNVGVDNARVGLHTFFENDTLFANVLPFDSAQKDAWFTKFYSVNPAGETPLPDAVFRIGEYFANSGSSGLPGALDPLPKARDTAKCESNYHLVSTDGYWNLPLTAGTVGDQDRTVPSLPVPGAGLTPGAPFPTPYNEGPTPSANSVADLAMKYWITDLRPDLENKVQDTVAPWQHVTMYALSIGAEGNIVYKSGLDAIKTGARTWPVPQGNGRPDSIDDLWHAALNSRGEFYNAADPQELAERMVGIVNNLTASQSGTGTAVGIAGPQLSATRKYGYRTSYERSWWGDVRKYLLDTATGALPVDGAGLPRFAPVWSASDKLDTLAAGTGWDTRRRIVTIKDNGRDAIPFRLDKLDASQKTSLKNAWSTVSSPPTEQQVLDFLRGDRSNEGSGTSNFRVREHLLGDIVYSGAVPVGAPSQPYDDAGNPGYPDFVTLKKSRTPMVYVGANDGMMHALDDSDDPANYGKETWAFIPNAVFKGEDPNDTAHPKLAKFTIGALSYRVGGIPSFAHQFYVNATPRVWDVDFNNTNTSTPPKSAGESDWHTILVGGLGAGGRAVYALDVTNPVGPSDDENAIVTNRHVLWEFTDENLGYVFDAPTLVKTRRFGWVVLVASGYNNTKDGKGRLYILDPKTGQKLREPIETPEAVSANDPIGLSAIRAFTSSRRDPYVLQAYGGDLKGNVWRFDLSDPDESKWKAEKIAKLTFGGKPQPITTGVRIEIDQNVNADGNNDRYLFVGTGQLLDQKDLSDPDAPRNTLYVIRDGTRTAAEPAPASPYTRDDLNTVVAGVVAGFTGAPKGRGWYQDAAEDTEKIGTDVFADVQTVVYSFSKPGDDPCEGALTSNLFARNLKTGSSVLQSAGGSVVASINDIGAIAGVTLIQGEAGIGAAASGDIRAQVTTMRGQVFSFGVNIPGSGSNKHRVAWRLLNRN